MKIKSFFIPVLVAVIASSLLPSCNSDEEVGETSPLCYISGFSLGTLKRDIYLREDSFYTVTFNGAGFPMVIDQRSLTIANYDSLPCHTHVDAILANVTFTGLATYTYDDITWYNYSAQDSINFSQPVKFQIYPTDGSGSRIYTVKVNVHQQNEKDMIWKMMESDASIEGLTNRSMVACQDGTLVMMAEDGSGNAVCAQRAAATGTWTISSLSLADACTGTLQQTADGTLMMGCKDGSVVKSDDGISWTELLPSKANRIFAGVSEKRIYTIDIADKSVVSYDMDGGNECRELLDDDAVYLPESNVNLRVVQMKNGGKRLVMAGSSVENADKSAEVWSKMLSSSGVEEKTKWMYFSHNTDSRNACPDRAQLFVFPYDEGLVAFGGAGVDAATEAMDTVHYSPDYGITWMPIEKLCVPAELKATKSALSATIDGDGFIWIVAGKDTWRGRLNRVAFEKK